MVVGASGNIGTALLEALGRRDAGVEIVALARRLPVRPISVTGCEVTWRAVDVRSDELTPHFAGADVVVNLAWLFHPSHHPQSTWRSNVYGAAHVLDAVQQAGVGAVVWSSSVAAYSHRVDNVPTDESWPTHGSSDAPYVREKSYIERLLDSFETTDQSRRVVRIRPAFVFHRRAATQQRRLFIGPLLPRMLASRRLLPWLPVPAGLLLQTCHASDVGEAFASAALADARGAFNICSDGVLHPEDLAEIFDAQLATLPPRVFSFALRGAWRAHLAPAHPALFDALMRLPVMANDRAKRELDWRPTASAADALTRVPRRLAGGRGLSDSAARPGHQRDDAKPRVRYRYR